MDEREAQRQVFINPPVIEYSHQNPHPLFGKDPNILNAQGHTEYPKWIKVDNKEVLAKDKKHENELLGIKESKKQKILLDEEVDVGLSTKGWDK